MKAISLWQPWATAMAMGLKTIETRSWFTRYRGDLLICSTRREPAAWERELLSRWEVKELPLGVALCVVNLYDCVPVHAVQPASTEKMFGDYTDGRHAWLTNHLHRIKKPFPVQGRQGLFEVAGYDRPL
jgi:activating signal cointegrator 1